MCDTNEEMRLRQLLGPHFVSALMPIRYLGRGGQTTKGRAAALPPPPPLR